MIPPLRFLLNDREQSVSRSRGAVLLDVLRDDLGLTGTKDACREGDCGSCLVLLGTPGPEGVVYRTVNSCLLPLGEAEGRHVVTIEGLNQADLSPVQQALIDEGAIQCGYLHARAGHRPDRLSAGRRGTDRGRGDRRAGRQHLPLHGACGDQAGHHPAGRAMPGSRARGQAVFPGPDRRARRARRPAAPFPRGSRTPAGHGQDGHVQESRPAARIRARPARRGRHRSFRHPGRKAPRHRARISRPARRPAGHQRPGSLPPHRGGHPHERDRGVAPHPRAFPRLGSSFRPHGLAAHPQPGHDRGQHRQRLAGRRSFGHVPGPGRHAGRSQGLEQEDGRPARFFPRLQGPRHGLRRDDRRDPLSRSRPRGRASTSRRSPGASAWTSPASARRFG